ncbi:hypothetical protein DPSP01_009324 [Paraphaeosphaeria sporulosa]
MENPKIEQSEVEDSEDSYNSDRDIINVGVSSGYNWPFFQAPRLAALQSG